MKRIEVALLVLLVCLAVGCRKSTTVVAPDGSRATVTKKGDAVEVTVKGADGGTVRVAGGEGGVALPEGFPKDVPIYPGATVTTSATVENAMNAVLKTSDPVNKVAAFYKEKLKANGWESKAAMDMADGTMLSGKKENRTQTTMIARDGDNTMVTLSIATEKK
jgi:hypothetical protein